MARVRPQVHVGILADIRLWRGLAIGLGGTNSPSTERAIVQTPSALLHPDAPSHKKETWNQKMPYDDINMHWESMKMPWADMNKAWEEMKMPWDDMTMSWGKDMPMPWGEMKWEIEDPFGEEKKKREEEEGKEGKKEEVVEGEKGKGKGKGVEKK
ncbi:MAG: hypothetical protein M1833_002545 [Piccolia ochrophora]|nr:MAG: hypothetical protein M1833_002545 [Piccolia ochrophora]